MGQITGRTREIAELNALYQSTQAQLVAIYGRRRVGKTFLVDQVFKGKITFRHAGLSPIDLGGNKNAVKKQLKHFYNSLLLCGVKKSKCPSDWLEAFFMLEQYLESIDNGSKQLIFLDELPWMDTPRSGFLSAFEAFWNTWACHRDNIMVIVCGSANSWILDNLINNHGGLYNRTTYEIKLSPFTLKETEEYLISKGIQFSRYDIAQANMILGGIPYYLGYLNKDLSLAQNIDLLFFHPQAKLKDEYERLFSSIFSNADEIKKLVKFLAGSSIGYTRKEVVQHLNLKNGGDVTKTIRALDASDFIIKYNPFGAKKREEYLKLQDPFCLFYLRFVEGKDSLSSNFWTNNITSQQIISWRGLAFENLCFRHIKQIKNTLGIAGVETSESVWFQKGTEDNSGLQIDMLIYRKDNVVNMCEIKFYNDDYEVDNQYMRLLMRRRNSLEGILPKRVSIQSTLITTFGLKYNKYSNSFNNTIVLDDLFS